MQVRAVAALAAVAATVATSAATFSQSASPTATRPLQHAAPQRLYIGTDFPLQGYSADTSADINRMIALYLDQRHHRIGRYDVQIRTYDDSTPQAGQWDVAQCRRNARDHVGNAPEVAVLGTYNSGCAAIELPTLNKDPDGPMLMVSPSNTYTGLTKHWATGDPKNYYPTGKRNYARVLATDSYEGPAGADFLKHHLHAKRVFVLNDGQVYGKKLAHRFVHRAKDLGVKIVGNKRWNAKANNYKPLFRLARSRHADAVYLSGLYDNNGHQVLADKVSILGNNKTIPLLVPDAFFGYPDLEQSSVGRHIYLTYSGEPLQPLLKNNAVGRKMVEAFRNKYHHTPKSEYVLDAVAALQVIDAAIRKSDGTRAGVTHAVFSGHGITIPTTKSALGRRFTISPHTGDTNLRRITVDQLRHRHERFVTVVTP